MVIEEHLRRVAHFFVRTLILLAVIFCVGTGLPNDAWAQGRGENISSAMDAVKVAPSRRWTVREMKAAKPFPLPAISRGDTTGSASMYNPAGEPTGPAGFTPGGPPKHTVPPADSKDAVPAADAAANEVGGDYKTYPYRTVGKLFYKISGRNNPAAHCTAVSIGNQAVWTAGHCVHRGNNSPDGWAYDVVFVPAYKDGNAPFGQWPVKELWTRATWYQFGKEGGDTYPDGLHGIRRDMGGAILGLNNSGQKISEVVGYLGFTWNQPREQYWTSLGYPGQPSPPFPSEASRMFVCTGDYLYSLVDWGWPTLGPMASAMGCNMGGGASGGPWIKDVSSVAGNSNYLGGNNSGRRDPADQYANELISPYFDDEANALWTCLVQGDC